MKRVIPLVLSAVVLFALAAFATQSAPPVKQPAVASQASDTKQAASCQRCGDGYCAPSCENEFTCPKDCKPSPSKAARPAGK